jgi:hypothetical protein
LATAVDLNKAITTLLLVEGTLAEAVNIVVANPAAPETPFFRLRWHR